MPPTSAITDDQVTVALCRYAGMVDRVLRNPERWLGLDEDPPPNARFPARALDAVRDRTFGGKTPASPTWDEEPVGRRVDWWVTRIGISAGLAAAAPRFFGALVNRVPVQGSLGAAAAGLAVCATAREHGRTDPQDWVPLLGRVLFDRDLEVGAEVPGAQLSDEELGGSDAGQDDGPDGFTDGARRAARTLWGLTRALLDLGDLLDHRPRGGRLVRLVAQVPVVGVASGWLDERSGIKAAARETTELLGR